jgi:hypothetical protein
MLDQKNPTLLVDHQRAHAERHGARETPIGVQRAPYRGLEHAARRTEAEAFHAAFRHPLGSVATEAIASGLSKARLAV